MFGKRWAWDFNYVNENVYTAGVQAQERADGTIDADDLPVLYLPVDAKVEVKIESRDVIHSFWIVDFLYKKDMIPGKSNYWYFIPQKEGVYEGKCAELCGEYHSQMLFEVHVVSQEEYDAYIESLARGGQRGPARRRRTTRTATCRATAARTRTESMTTTTAPSPPAPATSTYGVSRVERKGNVFVKWITSTDHKIIGYLYLITSFFFFLLGGVMALVIRAQLFAPGPRGRADR